MCVTVDPWQICDAIFSFMRVLRSLATCQVVGLLRSWREPRWLAAFESG